MRKLNIPRSFIKRLWKHSKSDQTLCRRHGFKRVRIIPMDENRIKCQKSIRHTVINKSMSFRFAALIYCKKVNIENNFDRFYEVGQFVRRVSVCDIL